MNVPDVLGYTLGEAKAIIKGAGITDFVVKTVAPPRDSSTGYDDSCRVLRVKETVNSKIEIIVCKPL